MPNVTDKRAESTEEISTGGSDTLYGAEELYRCGEMGIFSETA
jgi:hypothetical protein